MSPIRLPDISSRAWEHPADRAALQALRRVPGFDLLLRRVFGLFTERALRLITEGSAVEVGPDQFPRVHALYGEVLDTLDAPERWTLYLAQSPVVAAGAVGMDRPFIVLDATAVSVLPEPQVKVWLAQEVGHVMSDHALYKTMLRLLLQAGKSINAIPLAGLSVLPILAALLEWDRKSELSADRAALLATQDPEAVRQRLLRQAGGVGEGADISAFREQARRYEEDASVLDSMVKTLALLSRRHPFPVQRMREVDRWLESGAYAAVLAGEYPRRQDDPESSAWAAWKEAAEQYGDGLKATTEPLSRWLAERGSAASDKAGSLIDRLRGRQQGEEEPPPEDEAPGDDPEIIDV